METVYMKQLNLFSTAVNENTNINYLEEDYILVNDNRDVYNEIISGGWRSTILYGLKGSGKSYLLNIWRNRFNALDLKTNFPSAGCNFFLDDVDQNLTREEEKNLLLCLDICSSSSTKLLLTSATDLMNIDFRNLDLRSKLFSINQKELARPGEDLRCVIITKEFYLRKLRVENKVVKFLDKRFGGCYRDIVRFIDHLVGDSNYRSNATLTIQYVKRILDRLE